MKLTMRLLVPSRLASDFLEHPTHYIRKAFWIRLKLKLFVENLSKCSNELSSDNYKMSSRVKVRIELYSSARSWENYVIREDFYAWSVISTIKFSWHKVLACLSVDFSRGWFECIFRCWYEFILSKLNCFANFCLVLRKCFASIFPFFPSSSLWEKVLIYTYTAYYFHLCLKIAFSLFLCLFAFFQLILTKWNAGLKIVSTVVKNILVNFWMITVRNKQN